VNNAGTLDRGPFLDSSDQAYDKHFDLIIRLVVELSKDAARRMVKAGWGRIINIGSAFGEAAPVGGVSLYIVTKFAVHGFTRALSRELGPTGVTVNGIQPGPTNTELSPEDGPASEAMKRRTSVGRYGRVEEIASAAAFLANPESAFINGEILRLTAGGTPNPKDEPSPKACRLGHHSQLRGSIEHNDHTSKQNGACDRRIERNWPRNGSGPC
jgi:3-oxoacyl-[acyl-carrier protein] reductase